MVHWEATTALVFADLDGRERSRPFSADEVAGAVTPEALHVDAVVVAGCDARATLRRASYFAPVARRIALVHKVRDLDDLLVRAAWLEVGIARVTGDELQILAHPGPVHGFDDAFKLRFAKKVLSSHAAISRSAGRHPARVISAGA
jgi:hypothetical protein